MKIMDSDRLFDMIMIKRFQINPNSETLHEILTKAECVKNSVEYNKVLKL
jgi:hypothetical protein